MRRIKHPRHTAIYFSIGLTLMVIIKLFVLGEVKYWKDLPVYAGDTTVVVDEANLYQADRLDFPQSVPPEMLMSEANESYMDDLRVEKRLKAFDAQIDVEERRLSALSFHQTEPKKMFGKKGRIVIILDDMGMNRTMSNAAIDLPHPLTLAFLPYAPKLPEITGRASQKGHELMIHVPMEPMSATTDPGPMALKDGMSAEALQLNLRKILKSFDGYTGINNHMGSKLTKNSDAMRVVMDALVEKDLLFVDSKTSAGSVAADVAAARGLRYAQRDVFLDHEDTPEFVDAALKKMERIAARRGLAIGIGHPKKNTVEALRRWIPTLAEKNLTLVPVSEIVKRDALKIGSESLELPQTLQKIEPATY